MSATPERFQGLVGQGVAAIDTPALVVDLDAMERNLHRMADWCQARGLRLRPHAKMHKCAELAKLQMAHGAVGVCVQKIGEALALAAAGVADVYISNEVVDPAKLARLARAVRAGGTRFAIAVDSALGIERLAQALAEAGVRGPGAIDVFVEIDVGHGRCGATPGEPALAFERGAHDQHPEVRLGAARHGVLVALVDHLEPLGRERGVQMRLDAPQHARRSRDRRDRLDGVSLRGHDLRSVS